MRKQEPNIIALIRFFESTEGKFLEMDHTVDSATIAYLKLVYETYASILAETKDEVNADKIVNSFEKMYNAIKIENFNSKLYYDLKYYIQYLKSGSENLNMYFPQQDDFKKDMVRIKIILNENGE